MRELRCKGNKLHGLVVDEDGPVTGMVEFRCDSKFCGKAPGVVVLHRFNLGSGEYNTRQYREPHKRGKEKHAPSSQHPSVWSS